MSEKTFFLFLAIYLLVYPIVRAIIGDDDNEK